MTIKEFERKYEIPYGVVYNATFYVKPTGYELKNREYSERDLAKAVIADLKRKRTNVEDKLDVINRQIQRVTYHLNVDKNHK